MSTGVCRTCLAVILAGLLVGMPSGPPLRAQAPTSQAPVVLSSLHDLEELVGRIALYPDDLLAIVLPASTYPLDVVQAERFLQRLKQDPKLQPDPRWHESVRNLLNYPEVVAMMSQDLDWTQDLGEAVVGQQADVMKAIQLFRVKASEAGNLRTDDKQIIVVEKEVVKIVPANPEVIYVPQYQPSTVVVTQVVPVYAYYPTPYPVYYYPYPPGAAFATGFFFGAATAWAFNWGGSHIENNININRTDNININRNNPEFQQKTQQAQQRAQQAGLQPGQGGGQRWQSQKGSGEVSGGRVSPRTDARPGYGGGGQSRGDAFGSYGRGSDATQSASRGMQSRGEGGFGGGGRAQSFDRGGAGRGGGSASLGGGFPGGGHGGGISGGGRGGGGRRR